MINSLFSFSRVPRYLRGLRPSVSVATVKNSTILHRETATSLAILNSN